MFQIGGGNSGDFPDLVVPDVHSGFAAPHQRAALGLLLQVSGFGQTSYGSPYSGRGAERKNYWANSA